MPKNTKSKIKANSKYDVKTYAKYMIRIRKTDERMIGWLKSKKSVNGYIISLIRDDMP